MVRRTGRPSTVMADRAEMNARTACWRNRYWPAATAAEATEPSVGPTVEPWIKTCAVALKGPFSESIAAVSVAFPGASAVTYPASTVAARAGTMLQATPASGMTAPDELVTVAVNWYPPPTWSSTL